MTNKPMQSTLAYLAFSLLFLTSQSIAQDTANFTPEWVKRSNEIAYKVLESNAKFAPEFSGQSGVDGYDEEIFDLRENLFERQIENAEQNIAMLTGLLASEEDPRVQQDIEIMIKAERDGIDHELRVAQRERRLHVLLALGVPIGAHQRALQRVA